MKIDPDDNLVCETKLNYIEPKWGGSIEAMLNFGHECVTNTNWGGRVPLVLADVRTEIYNYYTDKSEQTDYWKKPEVWQDIKAAYDRFFEVNPDDTLPYRNYALYAYNANQWEAFVALAPKVRPEDHSWFGNQNNFNRMIRYANRMIRQKQSQGTNPSAATPL